MKKIIILCLSFTLLVNFAKAQHAEFEDEMPLSDFMTVIDSGNVETIKNVLSGKYRTNLRAIRFNSGAVVLSMQERMYLDTVADYIVNVPTINLKIVGHTDNLGSYPRNKALSLKRANAVADYLVSKGVRKGQILTEGKGPDDPIASNNNVLGRSQNRRVELYFLSMDSSGSGRQPIEMSKIKMKDGSIIEAKFISYSSNPLELRYIAPGPDETVKVLRMPDVLSINFPDGSVTYPEEKPDPLIGSDAFKHAKNENAKLSGAPNATNNDTINNAIVDNIDSANHIDTLDSNQAKSFSKLKLLRNKLVNDSKYGNYIKGNFPFVAFCISPITIKENNYSLIIPNAGDSGYVSSLDDNSNYFGVGFQIGLEREFGKSRPNVYYRYMYKWTTFKGVQSNLFSFGFGKSFGLVKQYRIGVDLETGYIQKKLDDMELPNQKFTVGNVTYKGGSVSVRYRNSYYAISPNITYELFTNTLLGTIRFNAGFTLSSLRRTVIKFKGKSQEGTTAKVFSNVDGRNIYLDDNNSKNSGIKIYGISGIFLSAGIILK